MLPIGSFYLKIISNTNCNTNIVTQVLLYFTFSFFFLIKALLMNYKKIYHTLEMFRRSISFIYHEYITCNTNTYWLMAKYCLVVVCKSIQVESIIRLGENQLILSAPVALNNIKAFSTPFL